MSSSEFSLRLATTPVVSANLEQIAREGARRYLQKAIEDEVAEYVDAHRDALDASGHRLVVRNGHKPPRTILTGVGPLEVTQPRVDDRRIDENGERFRFTSRILPPYLRKTKTIEELVPWLYLKGISTNDMSDALIHLGFDGSGLSPASVVRMKELWIADTTHPSRYAALLRCLRGDYFSVLRYGFMLPVNLLLDGVIYHPVYHERRIPQMAPMSIFVEEAGLWSAKIVISASANFDPVMQEKLSQLYTDFGVKLIVLPPARIDGSLSARNQFEIVKQEVNKILQPPIPSTTELAPVA
jgi:hypothetical protein